MTALSEGIQVPTTALLIPTNMAWGACQGQQNYKLTISQEQDITGTANDPFAESALACTKWHFWACLSLPALFSPFNIWSSKAAGQCWHQQASLLPSSPSVSYCWDGRWFSHKARRERLDLGGGEAASATKRTGDTVQKGSESLT